MATFVGLIRQALFAPSMTAVTSAGRGFQVHDAAATRQLDAIPQAVVAGFEVGIAAGSLAEIELRLDLMDAELRGFGYEGATMALTILDRLPGRRRFSTRDLLLGPAQPHIFLAYIGIGFAMGRLPRRLWAKALPDLTGTYYYPNLMWFAVDGYGFDRAYFDTRRWVDQQFRPQPYSWLGDPDYFLRVLDHGIGRALWFIHGANPAAVSSAVGAFDPDRRPDLWSGVGLAAAFAGGTGRHGLRQLLHDAGEHRPDLALGVMFAAKARDFSGTAPGQTELALEVVCGLSMATAIGMVDSPAERVGEASVDYKTWRQRIRQSVGAEAPVAGQ